MEKKSGGMLISSRFFSGSADSDHQLIVPDHNPCLPEQTITQDRKSDRKEEENDPVKMIEEVIPVQDQEDSKRKRSL